MTDRAHDDVAFLKRMALAGRGAAAPAPVLMAVFGLAYGVAALCLYLGVLFLGKDLFRAAEHSAYATFLRLLLPGAHVAFLMALLWTGWRVSRKGRYRVSRGAAAAWQAAFIGLVTFEVAMRLYAQGELPTDNVYAASMSYPAMLVLWGCAWWVTAALTERRWAYAVAGGSFAAALAAAEIGNSIHLMGVAAACLLLLAFLPGMLLILRPKA